MAAAGCPLASHALDPAKALTQYGHDHWTAEDGLPVTSVEVLSQTPDGYLWIGTEEGLARFDGARFVIFDQATTPGFSNHNIRALFPRRQGGLWVGTWRGLYRLEGGQATAVPVIPEDPLVVIEALFEAPDGTLWVGTQGYGVVRLGRGEPVRYGTAAGLPHNVVWSLLEDREGSLWIGTHDGLARLRDGKVESFAGVPGAPARGIGCIIQGADGSVWICGKNGVSRYRDGRFSLLTPADGLIDELVDALWEDPQRNLWIGSRRGLSRLSAGHFQHFLVEDGLADRVVRALWMDSEGSLWVGTQGGGLERFRDGKFTLYGQPEGLADSSVNVILEEGDGALWFGTRRGLTRSRGGELTSWVKKAGLATELVTSLVRGRDGTLWVGTAAGVSRSLPGGDASGRERFEIFRPDDPALYTLISSLHEDREGGLWIGTPYGGLFRWADGKLRAFTVKDGAASDSVTGFLGSRDGGVWIATSGAGVMRYEDGAFTDYGVAQGLKENVVYSLYEDAEGALWIGTYGGGLSRLAGGRIDTVTTREGLFDNVILQILEDDLGNLWLASSRGIARVPKADVLDLFAGRREAVSPTVYGTADGLRSRAATGGSFPNAYRDRGGRLWFATDRGAVAVDPRNLPINRQPPRVVIEGLTVDGESAASGAAASLTLQPGSNRIEIAYTALSFLAPERMRFKVRLEGFDEQWVDMGNRRLASYTNLPPGAYRFRVAAANADGVWNEEGAALGFSLAPRFYQTPWFYALAALLVVLGAWGLYQARTRALAARYEAVVGERTRIARELHDSVAQGLAGVSLQLEAARETLDGTEPRVRPYLARAHHQVRETLAAARRTVWNLRAAELEDRDLPEALSLLARTLSAPNGPTIDVELSGARRPLPGRVEENLFRIGQEAMTNAVRHAHADRIRVELAFEAGQVRLSVEDDGTGLPGGTQPGGEAAGNGSAHHFGMLVMSERAEELAGHLAVRSREGHGTSVTVEVPVGT